MLSMDFTTTAVARHGIFNQTLSSFSKNLKGINLKDCRLVINVDPLPPNRKRRDVIKVAKKYFRQVKYNLPNKPNFTAAYNWVWENANTEYIFNLEDDWLLTAEVDVPALLKYFEKNDKLLQILLRAYNYHYRTCALSPSIIHRRLYSAVGGNMNVKINPEAQLRGERFGIKMPTRGKGVSRKGLIRVYPKKLKAVILKDLGRQWIKKTNLRKSGGGKKARFITWEKK
jgi:hypothetical protein